MSRTRIISWTVLVLVLGLMIHLFRVDFNHNRDKLTFDMGQAHHLFLEKNKLKLMEAWEHYVQDTLSYKDKFLTGRGHNFSKSLSVLEEARDDIKRAFYYDGDSIYLKGWQKPLKQTGTEVLSVGLLDHPQFKLAEIMEYRDQDYAGAVAIYEKLWLENPDDVYAANALARCLFKQGNYERALKLYRQIYLQNPQTKLSQEIPLGLAAGLQIISIYEAMNQPEKAADTALDMMQDMLDSKWTLSELKQQFFMDKIKHAFVPLSVTKGSLKRRYRLLEKKEKYIKADKQYVALLQKKVIPYLEARLSTASYYFYHLEHSNRPRHMLVLIPRNEASLILEVDFPLFLHRALDKTMEEIQKEHLDVGLTYGDEIIKAATTAKSPEMDFALSKELPRLKISLSPRGEWQQTLQRELIKLKHVYWAAFLCLAVLMGMLFMVVDNQIKLSELKTEFVSQVSHELRTPLTSLRAFSELMQDHVNLSRSKIEQYCNFMQDESMRLARLVENLLDITRMEKRKLNYRLEHHLLDEVVREAAGIFSKNHQDLPITLHLQLHAQAMAGLDRDAIIRVVLNLLDNARKYSREGCEVWLATRREKSRLVIAVKDQGVGMTRAEVRKVFKKFYQAKRTYEEKFKGVGLGLAIVKDIVKAHHGQIRIISRLHEGTTVEVAVPVIENSKA